MTSIRATLAIKAAFAGALIVLADRLFFAHRPGTTVGVFALIWLVGLGLTRPGLFREVRAVLAMGAAALLALGMIDRPSLLLWGLYALTMTVAVLSARVARGETAWRWVQKLVVHGAVSLFGPLLDLVRRSQIRAKRRLARAGSLMRVVALIAVPLFGGLAFLGLFAAANPLISDALARFRPPALSPETVVRVLFSSLVGVAAWSSLRPRWRRKLLPALPMDQRPIPGISTASVTLSLIVFNLLFALQNGLDLAFLWSGAPLPEGVTLADYAHRGAYPLILTALLAGAFVLTALRPGSETATRPLVRRLVMVWVAQNMLLVASSLLRTFDYVEVFSLTRVRLAAMIWMVLVAVGLLLICWRLIRNRSADWLVKANLATALGVLAAVGVVNLGPATAVWNVRHAAEVDGKGAALDLCYLDRLGPAALVSLAELERANPSSAFRTRVAAVRWRAQQTTMARQSHWRGWTWRDARRLAKAQSLVGWEKPDLGPLPRDCDGRPILPPPPVAPPPVAYQAPPVITTTPARTQSPTTAPLTSNAGH
ncbi:DUF4153 domain-containing protein [Brevundimonas goettingensis]|uniref:DUF4173 domain-containing protein n=1 Tax=Brevundimonas goettingensis TaxID=2774190 RepID=A0A975GWK6_9CAUL|nr:DUF4173 domain-containing protein [Brevundimonas goettingensis]QTC91958.1 DUF4173 domain-containing protein [Brevundimonas goettingensis]